MVRSDAVLVWSDHLCKKSLLGEWVGVWQTKFNVSPGPALWSLVLGPFGPDLGPDLDLAWALDLDLSLTIKRELELIYGRPALGPSCTEFSTLDAGILITVQILVLANKILG